MRTGIYKITAPSGNCYIGSAVKFNKRWAGHRSALAKGSHHSKALQAAWEKYGGESFTFERLLLCRKDDLLFFEQRAIDVFNPKYNMHRVAGSALGHKHSEATKAKLSAANKGTRPSDAAIAAAVKANTGRKHSAESVAKMGSMRGKSHSENTKKKIAESNSGQKRSIEQRSRIRASMMGRKASDEAKRNMSIAHSGRRASPEAKANMVAAQLKIQERKRNNANTSE